MGGVSADHGKIRYFIFQSFHNGLINVIDNIPASGDFSGNTDIVSSEDFFSFLGGLGSPAYVAMKAGLAGFTKAYADELGKYGITVNGIAPGYFQTAMTAGTGSGNEDDPKYIKIKEHIPADRWGERQDLMGATVFLASKAADYVNGTLLVVDGGYLVR